MTKADGRLTTVRRVVAELAVGVSLPAGTKVGASPDEPLCIRADHIVSVALRSSLVADLTSPEATPTAGCALVQDFPGTATKPRAFVDSVAEVGDESGQERDGAS